MAPHSSPSFSPSRGSPFKPVSPTVRSQPPPTPPKPRSPTAFASQKLAPHGQVSLPQHSPKPDLNDVTPPWATAPQQKFSPVNAGPWQKFSPVSSMPKFAPVASQPKFTPTVPQAKFTPVKAPTVALSAPITNNVSPDHVQKEDGDRWGHAASPKAPPETPSKDWVKTYGVYDPGVIQQSRPWQEKYGKRPAPGGPARSAHPAGQQRQPAASSSKPRAYSLGGCIDTRDLKPWQISRARAMEARGFTLIDEAGITPGISTAVSVGDLTNESPSTHGFKPRQPLRDMRKTKQVSAFQPVAASSFKPMGYQTVPGPKSRSMTNFGPQVTPLPFQPAGPVLPPWATTGLPYCDL